MNFEEQKTHFLALGLIYQALGMPKPRHPQQAAQLLLARGRFPLPTHKILGRRVFLLNDVEKLAARLSKEDMTPLASGAAAAPLRKRGRPSYAELAVRAAPLKMEVGHD